MIFLLTEESNGTLGKQSRPMAPFFIGFTVAACMAVLAPLTQGAFNPARDFGPRLVALMAGWEEIAIPGPRDGFWVYIIGPIVGGLFGGVIAMFQNNVAAVAKNKQL